MARLAFCDYHNMTAILEKYEHNQDFHQIVDFVEASHIRIKTMEGETKILATVDAPKVTSLAADEGSMQHKLDELTALCTRLQRQQSEMVAKFDAQELEINSLKARIQVLEDKDRGFTEQSGDDAPIKRIRLDEGEEAAERVDDDTEEMATVLTSMDAKNSRFIPLGSKEEAERFKRKGLRMEQESVKKLKTSEEVKETEEVPKDKVKEMVQLVPVKELYDTCGVHHVTSKDKEIFMLVEKDYPLRKGLAIVMICYKLQVENYSQMGRIVGNKMHKAFPLPEEFPTASEESSHCQKKRDATAEKIALLLKSSSNCQSKSYDSYAKLVPHV
nr:hypothetical protein [Tanacetum cinerariifolium]